MQAATHELKKQDIIKATTSAMNETAKKLYNKINEPFYKETFHINFNEALAKVPQLLRVEAFLSYSHFSSCSNHLLIIFFKVR